MERRELSWLCCDSIRQPVRTRSGIEFLQSAGLRLGRPELTQLAYDRAATVLARSEARGGFIWASGNNNVNPGLFQGIAGIGYELLRLAEPAALPSVLLWD